MGRKKIAIKPIGSVQSRKITYNKRKVGLLKKVVEISAMCGVSVNLEFEDLDGNVIRMQAHNGKLLRKQQPSVENTFFLTPKDYPAFEALPEVDRKKYKAFKSRGRPSPQDLPSESKNKFEEGVPSNPAVRLEPHPHIKIEDAACHRMCLLDAKQSIWPSACSPSAQASIFPKLEAFEPWLVAPIYQYQPPFFHSALW